MHEVRQFLKFINYYYRFMRDFINFVALYKTYYLRY